MPTHGELDPKSRNKTKQTKKQLELQYLVLSAECLEQNARCDLNTWCYRYLLTQCSVKCPRCPAAERKSSHTNYRLSFFSILLGQVSSNSIFHRELNHETKKRIYSVTLNWTSKCQKNALLLPPQKKVVDMRMITHFE